MFQVQRFKGYGCGGLLPHTAYVPTGFLPFDRARHMLFLTSEPVNVEPLNLMIEPEF